MKCEEIFCTYLINISKFLTPAGFNEMVYFIALLRLALN